MELPPTKHQWSNAQNHLNQLHISNNNIKSRYILKMEVEVYNFLKPWEMIVLVLKKGKHV